MKKAMLLCLAAVPLLLASEIPLCAESYAPDSYITLSFFFNPRGVGYKHRVYDSLYLKGDMLYSGEDNDLWFRFGGDYVIPHKIWIFRLYGGAGLQFSRNCGYQYPYLNLGTSFWVLYWEVVHPLEHGAFPGYRFGFSFKF